MSDPHGLCCYLLLDQQDFFHTIDLMQFDFDYFAHVGGHGAPYECSSNNRMHRFAEIVNDGGLSAPIRTPRGRDIFAACGQLKSASLRGKGERVRDIEAKAGI